MAQIWESGEGSSKLRPEHKYGLAMHRIGKSVPVKGQHVRGVV